MNTYKRNATAAGILLLIGTAAGFATLPFLGILNTQDYLAGMAGIPGKIITGGFLVLVMGMACAGVSIALYPALQKAGHSMALGSVAFRLAEGILQVVGVTFLIALLAVSREAATAADAAQFQSLSVIIKAAYSWTGSISASLAWCVGALLYYVLFYRSRLVPRWLSVWGIIGILLSAAAAILTGFQLIGPENPLHYLLHLPIMPQEIVLAVWLIVKGFNKPALASLAAAQA